MKITVQFDIVPSLYHSLLECYYAPWYKELSCRSNMVKFFMHVYLHSSHRLNFQPQEPSTPHNSMTQKIRSNVYAHKEFIHCRCQVLNTNLFSQILVRTLVSSLKYCGHVCFYIDYIEDDL
nr:hypothetical protein Iba_chr11bCG13560 [Ipomoea batatas]